MKPLVYAVDNRLDDGVWGASERDRRLLRRQRRRSPDVPLIELLQRRRGELEVTA